MISDVGWNMEGNGDVAVRTNETDRDSNMCRCKGAEKRFKADKLHNTKVQKGLTECAVDIKLWKVCVMSAVGRAASNAC